MRWLIFVILLLPIMVYSQPQTAFPQNAVPIIAAPDSGWKWVVQEINLGGRSKCIVVQQKIPEPLEWHQSLKEGVGYGDGVWGVLLAIAVLWRRAAWLLGKIKGNVNGDT